ncbi:uncharacterized protein J4E84_007972 [Alternaria hordeiaustralica]|uniref:uncharacterized protein n=1 Tax=Alternaria hordeiaustralica TaxID=1187925 RepID=UPI0020C5009F|nr:uncharacterized protein J4E84_007972 [Alternaria hordeiaustralica]KAI4680324.1 hypothetical protein J4E84_007972 [Alternaria hordeiaustralica]
MLSTVIAWGYYNECLPLDVLSRTDHYALQALKKLRRPFVEADLHFKPTPKQKERTQIIVGFATVLSDQQLITGVAILIAGLAGRCRITFYEFNIVTYLAYFATFTHALSLGVLQSHLYERKLVRDCRVVFTVGFLAIFAFSFIVNTVSTNFDEVISKSTLNVGNVLQCVFEASRFGKSIQFDLVESILILGLVLANHTLAVTKLFLEPETDPLRVLIQSCYKSYLRLKGSSKEDASATVNKADTKYYAWLQPPIAATDETAISIWFFFDRYYNSYISALPEIFLGMTYGTGSVVLAVWYGGLKPANSLHILGFGQVVAIVLLALTFLAAVEVINGNPFVFQRECNDD